MKKIFLTLFLFFILQTNCFAQSGVSFVYINGSNNNDKKMRSWYENGVKKLHPYMKKAFEENEMTQKYFLDSGKYFIQEKPVIFFWGDKSHNDLKFVENDLQISKGFSPFLAYQARSMLTHFLHDAIWVQKYHNMLPVLDDLQKSVKAEVKKGNKVVLYGYSAGSFVTYEYLLTRLPYINVKDFFNKVDIPQSQKDFVVEHPMKNTCMDALGTDLAVFSVTGHIIPNDNNDDIFKKDYMNLNNVTDNICIPENSIMGIVNFASPLVLFYSDLSDPDFQLTYYNRLLFKYIIENDMFWLTVNYCEDPLGFPGGRNLTIGEIEKIANLNIEPHAGFIYDQSDTKGRNMVFTAHTSYWATRRNFSKAVARAYANGYKHQYDDNLKSKTVKKYEKRFQIIP
jgi:hypothetical protein